MRCTLQRCVRSPRTAYFLNPSGHVAVRCSSRAAPAAVSTPHTYVPPTVCSVGSAGPSPPTVPAPTEVNHVVSRALQEGDWQRGAQLLRGAVRIGCVPPQSTYVAVIQAVATSGGCSAAVELINTLGTSRSSLTAMYNLAADVMQSNRGGTSSTISTGSPRELGSSDKELLGLVQAAIQQRIALSPQHRLALFHALLQAQQAQELVSLATALVSCMRSEAREVTSPATLSGSHDTSQPIDCLTSSELVATLQAAETTTDWKAASLFMSHWLDVSSAGSTAAIPSEALVYCLRTYADALQGEDTESIPWQRVAALAEQCTSNAQHGGDEAVTAALERLKAAAAASSCLEPSISTIGSADADSFVLRKLFLLDRPHENVRAAAAELALPMGLVPRLLRAAIPLLARDAHNSQGPSTYERWVHVVMFLMHLSSKSELQSRGTEDLQLAELFPHPDLVVGSSSEAMPLWKYLIQHLASHGDECHLETVDVAPKLRLIIWLLHYTRYTDQWYARNAKMAVLTDIADPQQSSSEAAEHGNLLHAREKLLDELYYAMTTRQQTYAIAVQRLLLEVVREVTLSSWMDSPQPSRDNMWHRLCVKLLLAGGAPDALEAGITTIADAVVASSKILTPSDWIPLLDYHRALLQEGVAHAQVFKELEATFRRYHAWEAALAYSDTHRESTQDTAPLRRCVIPLLLEAGQWELVLSHLPPPEGRTTSDRLSAFVAQKGIIEAAIESSVREKNADAVLRGVQSIHELQSVVEASGVLAEQAGGGALQWTASMHSDIAVSCALLFVELGCGEEAVTMVEVLERGGATASGTNASSATLVLGLQAYRRAFVEGVASISCTARDPPTSNARDRPLIQVCFASCGMFHRGDAITAFRILADNLRADDVDAPAADASSTFAQHSWVTNGEALIRNAPPPVLGACSGLFFILAAIVERMVKQICMECDTIQSPQSCSSHAKDVEGVARVLIAWVCTEEQVLVCSSMLRDAWMQGATGDEVSGVLIRLGRDLVQVVLVKNIPVRDEVIHLVQVLMKMKIPDNLELSELHELVKRRSHRAAEEVVAEVPDPTAFHRCVVVAHRLAEEYSTLHRDDDAVRVLDDLGEALFDIPSADSEIFNPAAVLRIVARSMDGRQARMDEAKKVVSSVLSAASPAATQRHFHTAIRCCVASGQWSTSFLLLCRLLSRHPLHSDAGVTLVAEEAALMSLVLQCMGKHAPWTSALRGWAHLQDLMSDGVAQALPISSVSAMASLCARAPPGTDAYHVVQLMQLAHKFGFSISSEMFDLLLSQLTKALLVTPSEYAVQAHAIATVTDFLGHARVERFMNGISAEAAMDATTPIMDDGAFPLTVDRTWMPAARPLLTPQEVHLLAQRAPETVTATATQLECLAAKQFGGRFKPLELPLLLRLYSQEVLQALQTPSLRGDGVDSPSLDSLRNSPLVWLMLSDILHRHAQSCGGGWLTTYTADWCGEALVEHVRVAWDGFMSSATAKQLWAECPMDEIENLVRGRWSPLAEEELRDEVRRRKGKPPLRLVTAPHFTRKDISRYWACYHRLLAPEMHFNGLELCCLAQYIPTIKAIRVRCQSDLPARDQAMWEVASAVQLGHFHEAVIPADDLLAGIRRRKSVQAILSMYTVAHKLLSSLNEELRTDAHNPHDSAFARPSNHGLTPSYRLVPTSELSTIRKGTRLHLVATVMHLQDATVHPTIPGRDAVAPLSSARPYQLLRAAALDLLAAHHVEGQTIGPTTIQKLLEASTSWKTEAAAYYERLHSHTLPDAAAWRRAVEVVSEELRCQSPSWARAAEQLVARGRPAPPAYPMEECLCQLRDSALRVTLRALHRVCQQQPSPGYLPDSLSLLLLEVLRRYLSSDCGVDLTPAPSFAFTMNDQRDAEERRMADLLWLCRGLSAGGVWEQLRPAHADAIGRLVGPLRRSTSNRRGSGA